MYFFRDVCKLSKQISQEINISKLFSLFVLIYIGYKIIRYSEFGNDAPSHLLTFYIISNILKFKLNNLSYEEFNYIYLLIAFNFLLKITMIFLLIYPLVFILKQKYKILKIFFSIPSFLIIIWFLKNYMTSSCLIFPLNITCFDTIWLNKEQIINSSIEGEAWSKDWPNRHDKSISMHEYLSDFNWLKTWLNHHFTYILKILIPYVVLSLILILFLKKEVKNYKKKIKKDDLLFNISIFLFGSIIFFLKFPLYRYGYSYIIILLTLSLIYFTIDKIYISRLKKYSSYIVILFIVIFSTKQIMRYINYFEKRPLIPQIKYNNDQFINKNFTKFFFDKNVSVFKSKVPQCMFNHNLCTPYMKSDLKLKKILGYKIFYVI